MQVPSSFCLSDKGSDHREIRDSIGAQLMHVKYFLLLALIAALAACGAGDNAPTPTPALPTPTPAATATPATVTLQFWTVLPDQGISEQTLNDLIQSFQKEYPSIVIKVSSQPTYTDLYRKVVASIAAGTLPDVVTGLNADILQYARLKALMPLDDFASDPVNGLSKSDFDDMPAGMLETTRLAEQGQKLYSLPFARGVLAVFYDWTAMKAIGITNTPKSWDEFKLHAKSLSKNPVRGFAYRSEAGIFDAMLMSRGGSLFNAGLTRATFNDTPGVDALTYLGDGVKEGWIYRAEGTSDMSDFAAGRTIFTIASTAAIPTYQSAINDAVKKGGKDFDWGVALLPQADAKQPSALLVGGNIAMMKGLDTKQQAAWLFMRWLMQPRVTASWAQATGVLPVRLSVRSQLDLMFTKYPAQKQVFDDLLPVAHPEATLGAASQIHDLINAALAAVDSGKASPKAALDDAAAKVTFLLNQKQ